jgi:hypothetical protein
VRGEFILYVENGRTISREDVINTATTESNAGLTLFNQSTDGGCTRKPLSERLRDSASLLCYWLHQVLLDDRQYLDIVV